MCTANNSHTSGLILHNNGEMLKIGEGYILMNQKNTAAGGQLVTTDINN